MPKQSVNIKYGKSSNKTMRTKKASTIRPVGRPKLYDVRLELALSNEMLRAIDRIRKDDESRLDVIRRAIAREISRPEGAGQ